MKPGRAALALVSALCALGLTARQAPVQAAEPAAGEPVHRVIAARGDTLIGLGKRWLADPARWPELARANTLVAPYRISTGAELRIPLRLMRSTAVPATLLSVSGQVQSGATALQAGQTLPEGAAVNTGPDGNVTIRLVDGTLLRLRPDSRLQLRESRELKDAGVVRSGARLDKGRVEIDAAPAPPGRAGFSIDTPQGLLGVRGTEFRVAADAAQGVTRGEVLGGTVAFDGSAAGGKGQRVGAGFGSVADVAGRVSPPVPLLAAPDTSALPALQERLLTRFALPPLDGATQYRGQVSRDALFDRVLANLISATPELRFADLPDGDYVLRVRAIAASGLEGLNADHRFRLKARPEAPLPSAPQPRAVSFGNQADFSWTANAEAHHYRLQLAAAADFKAPLRDLAELRELATRLDGLQPGVYHWRLASVREGGDQGPWGDARSFELRPLPPTPKPPLVGDKSFAFAWSGAAGQTFDFELARDPAFFDLLLQYKLDQPGIEVPLPGSGRFFVRLRAIDADGVVGPYTAAQYFDVPNCLRDSSGGCVRSGEQTLNLGP